MSITLNTTLEDKVEELTAKATRIRQSKDTEDQVSSAAESIGRVCRRLEDVNEKAEELQFYVVLYEEAFEESKPPDVDIRIRTALTKIDISDDEILQAAVDGRLGELEDEVEEAERSVAEGIQSVVDALKVEQDKWEGKLEAARELSKIVGGDSEFQRLIGRMRSFLGTEMWNTGKHVGTLAAEWHRYEGKWEENAGKHGWETFKQEHGLTEQTVTELKQFSNEDPVRLSDLSLSTLEDVKRVPELESALQLEVRSQ